MEEGGVAPPFFRDSFVHLADLTCPSSGGTKIKPEYAVSVLGSNPKLAILQQPASEQLAFNLWDSR